MMTSKIVEPDILHLELYDKHYGTVSLKII